MKQFQYTIKDELGVHARPAGLLRELAMDGIVQFMLDYESAV